MNTVRSLIKLQTNTTFTNNVRNYAFKSDLKIKWVRPEKIPCYKPAKSGDLAPIAEIDLNEYPLEFRNCTELATADENVKKLFSLNFQPRWKTTQVYITDVVDVVRRHPLDKGSMEARIARWTGAIRALQEQMDKFPRNKRMKVNLKELIEKRKKHLKHMRQWDYKRFEWLLENLNIVYKPHPPEYKRVTRKDSLRKLTQIYCDEVIDEKMEAYRLQLEEEQPAFLEEKIRTLEYLREEQVECKVEVTIKQEEIDNIKKQLNELLKQKSLRDNDN